MKKKAESLDFLTEKIREIAKGESDKNAKLKAICKLLKNNVSHYDWVGFYFVDKTK